MGNVVLIKSPSEMNDMKAFYNRNLVEKLPPGSVFSARIASCTITAYKSGKVLFQGANSEQEASRWGTALPKKEKAKTSTPMGSQLPTQIASMSLVGSDEVGTGDYFGPITVVAAYVNKENIALLKELGVKDSKNLTDEKIVHIAKQIKDIVPHSLLTLHNEKYNELQQSGMSQGKLKALLHNQAINHVLNKIAPEQPEGILIDQFAKEDIYFNYLKGQKNVRKQNVFFSTKAEGIHLSVAAASILARYAFVRHFEKLSDRAGFTLPKGAGSQVDEAAARLIRQKGESILPSFVKLHFANTEKARKRVKR
ncbi:ribonuclease HIII [Cytobacillus spongiae]|uniref:ribonuclease HIII n=1 Tax=Cytobacillus spongiae TaxID=2901381 RepID=UPI001F00B05F|nr:ribonuclease HIII [Cytobacillus spongiae]UII55121.1 ribonuclease HIII [Cytobacillus spongiae]